MAKGKTRKTVTIKLNRNGTMTFRSTGGYDLRKLFAPSELPFGLAPEREHAPTSEPDDKAGAE